MEHCLSICWVQGKKTHVHISSGIEALAAKIWYQVGKLPDNLTSILRKQSENTRLRAKYLGSNMQSHLPAMRGRAKS